MPEEHQQSSRRPHVAILGAGPIGLEAALAACDEGLPFTVFEASPAVGRNVRQWGHVRLFTPWEMNVSPRMRHHLEAAGMPPPDAVDAVDAVGAAACPTGDEFVRRVLEPLGRLDALRPNLELATRVLFVGRQGLLKHQEIATPERARRPFRLLVRNARGEERIRQADVVLDCTGTYAEPNPLGDGGIPAPGEGELGSLIRRDIPDFECEPGQWSSRRVLVVGAGHSAQTAVRDLARLAERQPATAPAVLWTLRQERPTWGRVADDPLTERARLTDQAEALANGASPAVEAIRGVVVESLSSSDGKIEVTLRRRDGACKKVSVDRVLSLTGRTGDHLLYRQLQVHECYATCGPIKLAAALLGSAGGDCLAQTSHGVEALINPEPGFFILGNKSYGRNNTFLLRVGWDQVREVFEVLRL